VRPSRSILPLLLAPGLAAAQPPGPEAPFSNLDRPARRSTPNELVLPDAAAPPMHATPGVPTPEGLPAAGGRVYPEGSFIARRAGRLIVTPGGEFIFVAAESSRREPPMVLLPCTLRTRLASALTGMPDARVVLSGQVFVYQGRHYVMPGAFALAPDDTPPEHAPTDAPPRERPAQSPAAKPGADDPDVQALIAELEARRSAPRALDPARPAGARPGAPAQTPSDAPRDAALPEGTLLVSRRARLVRRPEDGRYVATFDNDPASPAPAPAVLLPCRALESIESLAAWRGENVSFMLSGRVYSMNGTRYLLPVVARPVRDGDLRPLQ
jgi:hypothetical protein